jgi:2-iminobutanoate/2-iminopropanoate deaminase
MIKKIDLEPKENYTFSSCVIAGDFIFTSHQGGALQSNHTEVQLKACFINLENTLKAANATLDDVVQINLLLKNMDEFQKIKDVFRQFFKNGFPARTSMTSEFPNDKILVQIDAIAYKCQ